MKSISSIADIYLGGTPKTSIPQYWKGDIKWASAKDVVNSKYRYIRNTEKTITSEGVENSAAKVLPKDTIVITARGTVGKVCLLPEDMAFNQTCYGLVAKEGITPTFLYYSLINQINQINQLSYGTVFDTITMKTFNELTIWVPENVTQNNITEILSKIDDKIEVNASINTALEELGSTLFKRWFVDFEFPNGDGEPYCSNGGGMKKSKLGEIPENWELVNLGKLVKIIKGRSYRSSELQESKTALVTLKSIKRGGGFSEEGFKEYIGKYKENQIVTTNDIVISLTDVTQKAEVIGKPARIIQSEKYEKLVASLDLAIIRHDNDRVKNTYLYELFKSSLFQSHIIGYTKGTTVLHLDIDGINKFKLPLPEKKLVEEFDLILKKIWEKMDASSFENILLPELRDTLLPRLMSGKIRVSLDGD